MKSFKATDGTKHTVLWSDTVWSLFFLRKEKPNLYLGSSKTYISGRLSQVWKKSVEKSPARAIQRISGLYYDCTPAKRSPPGDWLPWPIALVSWLFRREIILLSNYHQLSIPKWNIFFSNYSASQNKNDILIWHTHSHKNMSHKTKLPFSLGDGVIFFTSVLFYSSLLSFIWKQLIFHLQNWFNHLIMIFSHSLKNSKWGLNSVRTFSAIEIGGYKYQCKKTSLSFKILKLSWGTLEYQILFSSSPFQEMFLSELIILW